MTETITYNGRQFPVISSTPATVRGNRTVQKAKRKAHRMIVHQLDGEL